MYPIPLQEASEVNTLAINTAGWAVTLAGLLLVVVWAYYVYT